MCISWGSCVTEILESIKSSFTYDIGLIVHLATLGYVLGFLLKNQIILRFLVFCSTVCYIIYYYFYPETPLWGALMGSVLILIANTIGTSSLLYDRFPFRINDEHMPIFKSLKGIAPGEFRRLMKISKTQQSTQEIILTEEFKAPTHLYYLLDSEATANKSGQQFTIPAGNFVGEISFILKGNKATATVKIAKDAKYLSWEKSELEALLLKEPNLQQAFEARIARDMANKLSTSQSQINDKTNVAIEY